MAAKIVGLDGAPISERTEPKMFLDTPEGQYALPVVVLASVQYDQLVQDIAAAVKGEQLSLPLDIEAQVS